MIHWQVKFRSLRGNRLYTVNIYDDNYTSNVPKQLIGADEPFSTMEDNSDDWFKPIRTQSGYLRIVDTGKDANGNTLGANDDWKAMMPTTAKSRPVTLTHAVGSSTIIDWQGYLQPQTFSGQMYEDIQVREFPLMCALSVLEGEEPTTADKGFVNFAYILSQIIAATGFDWDSVHFTGSDVAASWLTKRICWQNFIEFDDDNNRVAKYNYLQILEELCKYWGWTVRTYANRLYFVSPDDDLYPDFISTTTADIDDMGNEDITVLSITPYEWTRLNTNRDIYASVNNNLEIQRGIRKAQVSADFGLLKKIFSVPFSDISKDLDKPPYPGYIQQGDTYRWQKSAVPNQDLFHDLDVEYLEQSNIWEPCYFGISDIYTGNLTYKHNFAWKCYLGLLGGQGAENPPDMTVRFRCKYDYAFEDGVIYIKGTFNAHAGGVLKCKFCIENPLGNQWWTGSGWSSTETSFEIRFGNEQDVSQSGDNLPIITTRQLTDPYPEYEGYGMALPQNIALAGKISLRMSLIRLYDGTAAGEGIQALMNSLEIGFLRRSTLDINEDKDRNVFTSNTNKVFKDEVNVSTIFACDDGNNFGTGLLMNLNDQYCDWVPYNYESTGGPEKPEQHLLGRIINHGKNIKKKETVELRSNLVPDINPATWCNTVNMNGYPISISREWRDDVTKVIIMEA